MITFLIVFVGLNVEYRVMNVGSMLSGCANLQRRMINQSSPLEINELPDLVIDPFTRNGVTAIVWFLSKKSPARQAILSWRHALTYVRAPIYALYNTNNVDGISFLMMHERETIAFGSSQRHLPVLKSCIRKQV